MASKKSNQVAGAYPSIGMDRNYQCEQDVRTLTSAAEVLADRGRMSMALTKFKKLNKGVDRLVDVLSTRRAATRRG